MNTFCLAIALFLVTFPSAVWAAGKPVQDDTKQSASVLHVYGPGGPLPAMKEAADTFSKENHVQVVVTGGPLPKWLPDAQQNADLIYSGSEEMMSEFQVALQGSIDPASIVPLYLRKAAILVRPGNPSHIMGLGDLMKPGHRILVVNGAGQKGLWEDVAGRRGDIASVIKFRSNIATVALNSGDARTDWVNDKSLDAWLIWNIWQISNSSLAELVPVDESHQIYRDCGIGWTTQGRSRPDCAAIVCSFPSSRMSSLLVPPGLSVKASFRQNFPGSNPEHCQSNGTV